MSFVQVERVLHEAILLVRGWPPQEADHGWRHQRVVFDVPVIQAIADSSEADAVIDVSAAWGELTQIALMRRLTRADAVVTNTASIVVACSTIGASPRLPGRSVSSTTRSRTIATWSTLESSHVAV
jgi:hypothetical protein